jgi:hypothetical protein
MMRRGITTDWPSREQWTERRRSVSWVTYLPATSRELPLYASLEEIEAAIVSLKKLWAELGREMKAAEENYRGRRREINESGSYATARCRGEIDDGPRSVNRRPLITSKSQPLHLLLLLFCLGRRFCHTLLGAAGHRRSGVGARLCRGASTGPARAACLGATCLSHDRSRG